MDTKTIIYIVIGILMVATGLYIVYQSFQRQKNNKKGFAELNNAGSQPAVPSIVPRSQREALLADDTDSMSGLANMQPKQSRTALDEDDLDSLGNGSLNDGSNHALFAEQGLSDNSLTESAALAASQASGTVKSGVDALGDTLSSLEHATADIMPKVDVVDEEAFSGQSTVLDSHLQAQEIQDSQSALQMAEEVVTLTLLPNQVLNFDGDTVLEVLSAHGLKFGEMNLFHRFEEADGSGMMLFSVMRHAEGEGTLPFDLQTLSDETVDGLTFFLPLPHPKATAGLSAMLSLTGGIARDLNASIYDEDFELFDRQKRDDMAQYVHEYAKNS